MTACVMLLPPTPQSPKPNPKLMPQLTWLFLDLNAFFASCEQQERPELRGKPVAVIPLETDSTCVLAASYPAKARGIRTGTPVHEARRLCPDITFILPSHKRYVQYHHKVIEAVERCVPVEKIMSIDEVACRLTGTESELQGALRLAQKIKHTIHKQVGECLTSSIGLSVNPLLAKLASDMQKPDGLAVLAREDLPGKLLHLKPRDISGIGYRMEKRLLSFGIDTMEKLWQLSSLRMRAIWGGVEGARFHALLHGEDLGLRASGQTGSIGHQHVLEPNLRTRKGALSTLHRLLDKAAERLRRQGFYCRRMAVHSKLTHHEGYFEAKDRFPETQDTAQLLARLDALWKDHPPAAPLRVGITLYDLIPVAAHQLSLFENPDKKSPLAAIDAINTRFGRGTIGFGLTAGDNQPASKDKIAFSRVPDLYEL